MHLEIIRPCEAGQQLSARVTSRAWRNVWPTIYAPCQTSSHSLKTLLEPWFYYHVSYPDICSATLNSTQVVSGVFPHFRVFHRSFPRSCPSISLSLFPSIYSLSVGHQGSDRRSSGRGPLSPWTTLPWDGGSRRWNPEQHHLRDADILLFYFS